jgi:hypothetical protein
VLALLLRQDNLLIVPGLALGLWPLLEPGKRTKALLSGLLASAAATLSGYAIFWRLATGGDRSFPDWLLRLSLDPQYSDTNLVPNLQWHVDGLGAAVVGRIWQPSEANLWVGPAFVAACLGAGLLLRGTARIRHLTAAVAAIVLVRGIFYTWFDYRNWEWSVLTLILVAWLGSRMAGGAAARPWWARAFGTTILAGAGVAVLSAHAALTVSLAKPRFMGAMRQAVEAGAGCRFIASGHSPDLGFDFLRIRHVLIHDGPDLVERVTREVQSRPEPAMVVMDRWIFNGEPCLMVNQGRIPIFLDWMESTPGLQILRWEGRAYAVRYDPTVPR